MPLHRSDAVGPRVGRDRQRPHGDAVGGELGADPLEDRGGLRRAAERRAGHVQQRPRPRRCAASHSASSMKPIRSLPDRPRAWRRSSGRPARRRRSTPAAAGIPGDPSAARPIRWVPCRAVTVPSTTTPPGMPETPLSDGPALGGEPGGGLLRGVGDVLDVHARRVGDDRAGLDHQHGHVGGLLDQLPGVGGAGRAAADDQDGFMRGPPEATRSAARRRPGCGR